MGFGICTHKSTCVLVYKNKLINKSERARGRACGRESEGEQESKRERVIEGECKRERESERANTSESDRARG